MNREERRAAGIKDDGRQSLLQAICGACFKQARLWQGNHLSRLFPHLGLSFLCAGKFVINISIKDRRHSDLATILSVVFVPSV